MRNSYNKKTLLSSFLTFLFVAEGNKKKRSAKEVSEARKLRRLRWVFRRIKTEQC